jgi:hypothetical protein
MHHGRIPYDLLPFFAYSRVRGVRAARCSTDGVRFATATASVITGSLSSAGSHA